MRSNHTIGITVSLLLLAMIFQTPAAVRAFIFADNFESGDTCNWSNTVPGGCTPATPTITFPGLHLNEISARPEARGITEEGAPPLVPWLEIYYAGPEEGGSMDGSIDLSTIELLTETDGLLATLPSASMPPRTFLTIYMLPDGSVAGDFGWSDDFDFSDGEGSWYLDFGGIISPEQDDIALRDNLGETLSFVAYGPAFDPPSSLETDAVADGVWTAGERVDLTDLAEGESFGLRLDGFFASLAAGGNFGGSHFGSGTPIADDYLVIPWNEQTSGIQQPNQPLQINPRDGSLLTTLPVDLTWRPCPGASGYLLVLRDVEDPNMPGSTTIERVTTDPTYTVLGPDVSFNPIYWAVSCLYDDDSRRTPFTEAWVFGLGAAPDGPQTVRLGVTHKYQRKDSEMLCLWDFHPDHNGGFGCRETINGPDGPCNWDDEQIVQSPAAVRACGPAGANNCVRASIQMAHDFLTGGSLPLAQDYISYLTFSGQNPPGPATAANPEGDLGAGIGMTEAETIAALSTVLGVGAGTIEVDRNPTFTEIRNWIDEGRPVIVFRWWGRTPPYGHATVIYGYQEAPPFNAVFVHDPTDGPALVRRYSDYRSNDLRQNEPITTIVPPAAAGTPIGNPPNTIHPDPNASVFADTTDGDGVCNFDEIYRFFTDIDLPDTDFDQVEELDEVYSYTFPRGKQTFHVRPPDVDGDLKRAEVDCDTDNDGDHDGGEDIDGDGGRGEPQGVGPGETDVFNSANKDIVLALNGSEFQLGESVFLGGGTLFADFLYPFQTLACPEIPPETPIGGGLLFTDAVGIMPDQEVFTCLEVGCFITYLDRADDGLWQSAPAIAKRACDANFPFTCVACDSPDDEGDDFIDPTGMNPPDPLPIFDFAAVSNLTLPDVGFELITIPGPGGLPSNAWVGELIFEVGNPSGQPANNPPQTQGGWFWLQFQIPLDGNPPNLNWQVWDPLIPNWVPAPDLQNQVQINFLSLEGILQVAAQNPLQVGPDGFEVIGLRALSHAGQFFDVVPEPDLSGGPPVFIDFLPLDFCPALP